MTKLKEEGRLTNRAVAQSMGVSPIWVKKLWRGYTMPRRARKWHTHSGVVQHSQRDKIPKYMPAARPERALCVVLRVSPRVSYQWRCPVLAPTKAAKKKKVEDEAPPFKVSTHFLIPKHELMTKEEAEHVVRSFNATPSQFPYILATDPVAKEIGAKPGDFVRITRKSETAGTSVYYRYVVEG